MSLPKTLNLGVFTKNVTHCACRAVVAKTKCCNCYCCHPLITFAVSLGWMDDGWLSRCVGPLFWCWVLFLPLILGTCPDKYRRLCLWLHVQVIVTNSYANDTPPPVPVPKIKSRIANAIHSQHHLHPHHHRHIACKSWQFVWELHVATLVGCQCKLS